MPRPPSFVAAGRRWVRKSDMMKWLRTWASVLEKQAAALSMLAEDINAAHGFEDAPPAAQRAIRRGSQ